MPPSRWLELRVRVHGPNARDRVAVALLALGGSAVQERDDVLVTYIARPPDPERFVRRAEAAVAEAVGGGDASVTWRWRQAEDWRREWREGLRPRRVGRRLIVAPPWATLESASGDVVLVIDPGMAFGTGEHPTTRGALRLLERWLRPGDRVLDVGAGSGILSIAAAKLGAARVLGVDSDPDAMANARANIERNDVVDRVEVRTATVDAPWLDRVRRDGGVDLILANVLSDVITPLLDAFRRTVRESGRVIVGGILEAEADDVLGAARRARLRPVAEDREAGWWTAVFVPADG